ncbi:MAG: hypothetical protein JXR41_08290 [Bacteroidales bacterium]|nr:hypothetical protein [Bacteroidales bacterium]MBN2763073.1 hypothetical protein [Bacteroidales bacterium]
MKKMKIENWDKIVKWSYSLARQYAIENLVPKGVTSARKFDAYKQERKPLPRKFPRIPDEYFKRKGSWKGWRDFLGNPDQRKSRKYLSYHNAGKVAGKAGISNSKEYVNWKERPANLPSRPEYFYSEWAGWQDFLGSSYRSPDPRHYTKLNPADVRIIKHQLAMGITGAVLAKTFGVSEMQISRIKKGENWGDV